MKQKQKQRLQRRIERVWMLLFGTIVWLQSGAMLWAQDAKAPTSAPTSASAPTQAFSPLNWALNHLEISGLYSIWGHNQRGFLLGKDAPLDDADFVTQVLRVNLKIGTPKFGVVVRFDAAQGWWGVDNDPDITTGVKVDKDANGNVTNVTTTKIYNDGAMFRNKDTNYAIHFDIAYLYAELPWIPFPIRIQAGRQYYSVGNQLVLDQNYDGVTVSVKPTKWIDFHFMWGKISEGLGAYQSPVAFLMNDNGLYGDADLFGGKIGLHFSGLNIELYGLHYTDQNLDPTTGKQNWTYLPQGVGYLRSRFVPNLSQVTAFGLAIDGQFRVLDGLGFKLEGSVLFGRDNVANADHAGGMLDINNGELFGFNLYAQVTQKFKTGIPWDITLTFGLGSGDPDPRSGPGNINKIQTIGNFQFTNVWEDSTMPDIEGIAPQGLGSPISRGYREFENTIAFQVKLGANFLQIAHLQARLEASYSHMTAYAPVRAFDSKGVLQDASASDLGQEIDVNLILKFYGGRIVYTALFGVFFPGKAAGYLINGTDQFNEAVFELKQVLTFNF